MVEFASVAMLVLLFATSSFNAKALFAAVSFASTSACTVAIAVEASFAFAVTVA